MRHCRLMIVRPLRLTLLAAAVNLHGPGSIRWQRSMRVVARAAAGDGHVDVEDAETPSRW